MSFETIIAALDAKPSGTRYRAKCPAHGGRSQSLMISERDNGSTMLHCFAGCTPDAIMGAMGLDPKLAWRPLKNITNAQWQAKSHYISRVAAAIARDAYHIRMLGAEFTSGELGRVSVVGRLYRLAPSVFYPCLRLDSTTRAQQESVAHSWLKLAMMAAPSDKTLAWLLSVAFTAGKKEDRQGSDQGLSAGGI